MKKILIILLLLVGQAFAQYGAYGSRALLFTNNVWAGTQTFNGALVFGSTVLFSGTVTAPMTIVGSGGVAPAAVPNSNSHLVITNNGSSALQILSKSGGSGHSSIYLGDPANPSNETAASLVWKGSTNNFTIATSPTASTMSIKTVDVSAIEIDASQNVGIGTAAPVNLLNVDGAYNFFTDSSSVDDSWGFSTTGLEVLTTGMSIYVQIAVVNTDGATLQINALGAKDVHKQHNVALETGDVEVGQILHLIYDGTEFQMLSQLAQ